MKGVILCGGSGSRLVPMTKVTNKHLLPVYNKPMVYYPLATLVKAGISDIMVITGKDHAGAVMELLGSGVELGVNFTYRLQDKPGGIAEALMLCKEFVGDDNVAVILGDNIFVDDFRSTFFKFEGDKNCDCFLFIKEVLEPKRFGVATLNIDGNVVEITEKPEHPDTDFAITGLYLYSPKVFDILPNLVPSNRGELEITDVNNWFIKSGNVKSVVVKGFWSDAGTPNSLFDAGSYIKENES